MAKAHRQSDADAEQSKAFSDSLRLLSCVGQTQETDAGDDDYLRKLVPDDVLRKFRDECRREAEEEGRDWMNLDDVDDETLRGVLADAHIPDYSEDETDPYEAEKIAQCLAAAASPARR